ncbi:MAG TPA: ATP-binding protein [Ktedonobacterales bacterium]|nr:ATP-binding protein [Ktedonobacterales bacterium]
MSTTIMQTPSPPSKDLGIAELRAACRRLLEENAALKLRIHKGEERRRAMIHIMDDMNKLNKKLADQRKAMIHILADYEADRSHLARQTERLDNSRRALLHILQDVHQSNQRLGDSRKAMIHIMGDLKETTAEIQRREQELRNKQAQLVQAGKLATLGELTTGVAHELNNPLNNIGLFVGNVIDLIGMGSRDEERMLRELHNAMQQVRKAGEIISHLRTFGRAATVSHEPVDINGIVERALSLLQEQLRLRQIAVRLDLCAGQPVVIGNAIQLEQVFINLLTNARDALAEASIKEITIRSVVEGDEVRLEFADTGSGISEGLEQRIFDPFFTTKEVGSGTGLGLSITYGIIAEHKGTISVANHPGEGATFIIQLPLGCAEDVYEEPLL